MNHNLQYLNKYYKSTNEQHNKYKIPNIIMQTFETNLLPKNMIKQGPMTWINKNPEFNYIFFDKHDRREYIKKNYDNNVLECYDLLNHGSFQADLFRACYMYLDGGIYTDIDQPCMLPLSSIIGENDDFISGIERNTPHQMLIISSPNNPMFKHLIMTGIERVLKNNPIKGPFAGVGAGFFGPPAYMYSFIWFHTDINLDINNDKNAKWISNYKIQTGIYTIKNINFNIKKYSLFQDTLNGNKVLSISKLKYNGYFNDLKLLNIKYWTNVKPIK